MNAAIIAIAAISCLAVLELKGVKAQEKTVERARRKKTDKARNYQALIESMPDVIWTDEIYNEAYNF